MSAVGTPPRRRDTSPDAEHCSAPAESDGADRRASVVGTPAVRDSPAACSSAPAETGKPVGDGVGSASRRAARGPRKTGSGGVRGRFEAYGTYGELLLAGRPAALGTAMRVLRAELDAIDRACSRFRDDSELAAVNAAAGRTVAVCDLLAEAVEVALVAAAQTGGDVDPTLGAALAAAGYDADYATLPADGPPAAPEPPGRDAWREVELDRVAGTLRIPAGTALDLGATAKALAVDRAAEAVAKATGSGVLVNVGGDLAAAGPVPHAGWPVRLTDDAAREQVTRPGGTGPVVHLHGGGLATSSTVVRRWRRGGRLLHHVLDPRTGRPAEPVWRTVTVTAATCVDANTASTAAVVRGRDALIWLAELGLPSRLVDAAGTVHRVAGWPPDAGPGPEAAR